MTSTQTEQTSTQPSGMIYINGQAFNSVQDANQQGFYFLNGEWKLESEWNAAGYFMQPTGEWALVDSSSATTQ